MRMLFCLFLQSEVNVTASSCGEDEERLLSHVFTRMLRCHDSSLAKPRVPNTSTKCQSQVFLVNWKMVSQVVDIRSGFILKCIILFIEFISKKFAILD